MSDEKRKPGDVRPPAHPKQPQRITSAALLAGDREVIIEHDGRDYRLRLTQQGKLILTA